MSKWICPRCTHTYLDCSAVVAVTLKPCNHKLCKDCLMQWAPTSSSFKLAAGSVQARASDVDHGKSGGEPETSRVALRERNDCGTSVACLDNLQAELVHLRQRVGPLAASCDADQYHCPTCMATCNTNMVEAMKEMVKPEFEPRLQPRTCLKHPGQEQVYFCKAESCKALICADCIISQHKGHDIVKFSDEIENLKQQFNTDVRAIEEKRQVLSHAKQHVKKVLVELQSTAQNERIKVQDSFGALQRMIVTELQARAGTLVDAINKAEVRKTEVLSEQLKEIDLATGLLGRVKEEQESVLNMDPLNQPDIFLGACLEASNSSAKLKAQDVHLEPQTLGTISVALDHSDDALEELLSVIRQRGTISTRDVKLSSCKAEGKGLVRAHSAQRASFEVVVVTVDDPACMGEAMAGERQESGQTVELQEVAAVGSTEDFAQARIVEVKVVDRGDGTYEVEYVALGEGTVAFHVLVNKQRISETAFEVDVTPEVVHLHMHLEGEGTVGFISSGVIRHIGTEGGTQPFQNPHATGKVVGSMSSVGKGLVERIFQVEGSGMHDGEYNHTIDAGKAGSWVAVDLCSYLLSPTGYCLRTDKNPSSYKLRKWKLEASIDGNAWTTLKTHKNDQRLAEVAFSEASWSIEGFEGSRFRHFRVMQTGSDSSGFFMLCCAGFELYGTLYRGM